MRAHRTLAVLATAGAMLVATASTALVGPGAATAAPAPTPTPPAAGGPQAYPPPPPTMTVNHAMVKLNQPVRVSGNHFQYKEHISITILYRTAKKTVTLTIVADRYGRFGLNEKLVHAGYVVISAYGPKSHFYSWAYVIVQMKKGPHGITTQVIPVGPAAARPAPTKAAINTFNPLVAQQGTGPLGLGGASTGAANGNNADLVANSKALTPAGSQFPLGAAGAALAAAGILLTVLAFRRRRPEADS